MPKKKRGSRRRPQLSQADHDTIRAGLNGFGVPRGGNAFLHLDACFPQRGSRLWPKVEAVLRDLPASERRAIVRRRREQASVTRKLALGLPRYAYIPGGPHAA